MKKLVVLFAGPMLAISLAACGAATEATDDAKQAVGEAKNAVAGDPLTTVEVTTKQGSTYSAGPGGPMTPELIDEIYGVEPLSLDDFPESAYNPSDSGYPTMMTLDEFQCHEGEESLHLEVSNIRTTIKDDFTTFWYYSHIDELSGTKLVFLHYTINPTIEVKSVHQFGGLLPEGVMKTDSFVGHEVDTRTDEYGEEVAFVPAGGMDAVVCFTKN